MATYPAETRPGVHGGQPDAEQPWDPWKGHPPASEGLRNAFNPWRNDPEARAVIDQLLAFGRRLNDPSLGEVRPSRDDFERLVDELIAKPEGEFLLKDHPALGALVLAVIRGAIDGVVGGGTPIGYRP